MDQILVIEDEIKLSTLLSRALSASGFEVRTASNGIRGLTLARSRPFGLIVLDLLLPDLDGFSILKAVLRSRPDQQVLVLSALSDVQSKVRCLESGAADYVAKPFELPELIARVRRHLKRPTNGGERFLRKGTFSLDLQRRSVSLNGGGAVGLSTREFLLLDYLMRNEGDVCTRDELLERVWGYSFDPGTNVVDVCIGRLRHKLGGTCIETIRNVGYSFVGA